MAQRGSPLPAEMIARVQRLVSAGRSLRSVARELGLDFRTVAKYAPRKLPAQFPARAA